MPLVESVLRPWGPVVQSSVVILERTDLARERGAKLAASVPGTPALYLIASLDVRTLESDGGSRALVAWGRPHGRHTLGDVDVQTRPIPEGGEDGVLTSSCLTRGTCH